MADLIAVQCSHCGAESPFSLATPDRLSCDFCGFVGPLPESARHSLYYAAQVLPQLDASHRSLSEKHRRALKLDSSATTVRNFLMGLAVMAVLLWSLIMVGCIATGADAVLFGLLAVLPPAILLGAITLVVRAGRKARNELMGLYAAAAPVRQGAPTRCRVCGAVLPTESHGGVVSCGFCGSDNLVAPGILAAATWHRTRTLDEYRSHLDVRAKRAFKAAAGGAAVMGLSIVGVPALSLLAIATVWAVHVVVVHGRTDADLKIQYVAVRTNGRWCVSEWKGNASSDERGPFPASALLGRKVHHDGDEIKVMYVKHYRDLGNVAELSGMLSEPVLGACLVGEPPGPVDRGATRRAPDR